MVESWTGNDERLKKSIETVRQLDKTMDKSLSPISSSSFKSL